MRRGYTKNILKLSMISATVLLLASCDATDFSTATTYPMSNGTYKIVALASSESLAGNGSMERATKLCQARQSTVRVLKVHTFYQGPEFRRQAYEQDTEANHSSDYKSTLYFRCVPA
jgi:hypothetical protein